MQHSYFFSIFDPTHRFSYADTVPYCHHGKDGKVVLNSDTELMVFIEDSHSNGYVDISIDRHYHHFESRCIALNSEKMISVFDHCVYVSKVINVDGTWWGIHRFQYRSAEDRSMLMLKLGSLPQVGTV